MKAIQEIPKAIDRLATHVWALGQKEVYVVWFPDENEPDGVHVEVLDSKPQWEQRPGERWFCSNVNGGDSIEVE